MTETTELEIINKVSFIYCKKSMLFFPFSSNLTFFFLLFLVFSILLIESKPHSHARRNFNYSRKKTLHEPIESQVTLDSNQRPRRFLLHAIILSNKLTSLMNL